MYLTPLPSASSPHPSFPSGNHHTVLCVYEFVLLSVLYPHMNEIIWFLSCSICLVSLSMILKIHPCCRKWQYSLPFDCIWQGACWWAVVRSLQQVFSV